MFVLADDFGTGAVKNSLRKDGGSQKWDPPLVYARFIALWITFEQKQVQQPHPQGKLFSLGKFVNKFTLPLALPAPSNDTCGG